jgi:hypothetical protein
VVADLSKPGCFFVRHREAPPPSTLPVVPAIGQATGWDLPGLSAL